MFDLGKRINIERIFFFFQKYGSFENATGKDQGLAVIGIFNGITWFIKLWDTNHVRFIIPYRCLVTMIRAVKTVLASMFEARSNYDSSYLTDRTYKVQAS